VLDAYGNVATGYPGTLKFTSSDKNAVLPANYTFTAADAGMKTFGVTLNTSGTQSITATAVRGRAKAKTTTKISVQAGKRSRALRHGRLERAAPGLVTPLETIPMADDSRVDELLKELLDSGGTPEEVCRACPELLAPVRAGWQKLRALRAEVGDLFPESPPLDPGSPNVASPHTRPAAGLPHIHGHEVQELLGHGGVGVVYKAWHLRLQRPVAVKMLLAGAYAPPQELERFLREAETIAGLRHPNIVQVHEAGDVDGRPYFTMEFVEGGSLAQKLTGTPQAAHQAAALVASVAEAVHAAHHRGIIHRDLKPGNVLLTSDGIPKLSDFGLARHLEQSADLTQTGVPVGTPSYMAPEQAEGKSHDVGPAADTYALGAILYELITGRAPFRAETAAETLRQAKSRDPVPPSRLNAAVPRDVETICLKCMEKDPQRRYASALALSEDLKRFLRNEPIVARPVGILERTVRLTRRHPAEAALVATALTLLGLTVAGGFWVQQQQAEQRERSARQEGRESQAVEAVLAQAADLEKQGRWPESREVLKGAPALLGASASKELRERVQQAAVDADMVALLEDIRLRLLEGAKSHEPAVLPGEQLYAEAFRDYGIDLVALEPAETAARIRRSAIRTMLLAFLYDWVCRWESAATRARLREVLDLADDDPWRRQLRAGLTGYDAAKREELLLAPEAPDQPPVVVAGLGEVLIHSPQGQLAQALLHKAQERHPEDFWINYQLGYLLQEERPREAAGFFRAALASRPDSGQAQIMLGRALRDAGDANGAITAFRKAISLNPNRTGARDLARVLAWNGRLEEARAVWEKIPEGNQPDHDPRYGYAQLCAFLGQEETYHRARKALLDRVGDAPLPWTGPERDSLACLLLPCSGDELRHAVELADRAVALGPKFPDLDNSYLQFVKGLAEYRQGHLAQAVPLLRDAAALLPNRAGPRLALAMAQFQSGSPKEARRTLAAAVRSYNWKAPQADHPTAWVSHVLRREAEELVLPNLPAFLRGGYRPQDNDERLALLGACQFQGLYAAAARLYADAFQADPELADTLTTECRYRTLRAEFPEDDRMDPLETEGRYLAARCAALAGSGLGKDGARLSAAERAHWRQQARQWLRADLEQWARSLDSGSQLDRNLAKKMLTRWHVEPDLAGLFEPNGPEELSLDERQDYLALLHEVDMVRERIARLERASQPESRITDFQRESRLILSREGPVEKARVAWQRALAGNPLDHNAWHGYAEFCLFLGREDKYRRARSDLLARFFTTSNPYFAERTGRTCLLRPASEGELRQAVALIDRASIADFSNNSWVHPYIRFGQGLAEYRQGRLDQAIAALRGDASGAVGTARRLVLAMALSKSGQVAEARQALASVLLNYDWRPRRGLDQDGWICHALRREALGLILPNLPSFLDGKYQPQSDDERLALLAAQLGAWEFQGLHGAPGKIEANDREQVAAWERAIAQYRKLVTGQPVDSALLIKLAAVYQSAGRTREAVPLLVTASAANPKDTLLSMKVAALQAWFGQDREFAATRQRILAFARDTNDATTAERAAKAACLLPLADKAELEAVLALVRTAVKAGKGTEWWDWHLLAEGMAEYRNHNYAAAAEALFAAEKAGPRNRFVATTSPFYCALALFRQGKEEEARKLALATAAKMKPLPEDDNNPLAGEADHDDLILWLACKEAKAVIKFESAPPPKATVR
jgi:serine/threonine-protein kinase